MMDNILLEGGAMEGDEMMSYEDMMMEPMEQQPAQVYEQCCSCLAVLASDDDVQLFDKITSSAPYNDNPVSKRFNVKVTTYEQFLDDKKEDTFDFVILVFMRAASSDDLEMKADYYEYYSKVPLVHYAIAQKEQDSDELAGVKDYLKAKCDQRLFSSDPLVFNDLNEIGTCAENLISHMDRLHDKKEEIFEQTVKKAFQKFDKDGNGTIDAQELQELSKMLGQPLDDDQLAAALKDLDLNGDGVIDEKEFSRWYFTGMKSYNGATRSILQMGNQTSTVFDILAKEDIQKILKDDKSMTKHRIKIQFNEPPESYYGEIIYHILGPFTDKMEKESDKFFQELKLKEAPGAKTAKIYFDLSVAMKPGGKAKYEGYCEKLHKLFLENKPEPSAFVPDMHLKLTAEDDKITARFMVILPEAINPLKQVQVPVGLKEGLKDVDQYFKIKIVMGADAEEILTTDKPLVEHYLKGFSITFDIVFLRQLKKALMAGLEGTQMGEQIKEGLKMGGPAFALETNLSLELDFDDMEELKAHPMASTFLVSTDQLMKGILGKGQKEVLEWKPSFDEVEDKEKFQKHLETSDYCKEKQKNLEMFQMIGDLFSDFDSDCCMELRAGIFGLLSLEYKIEGAGYGDIINLMYKAFTLPKQESLVRMIISDYNYANEAPAEGDDMMEMMMEGDAMASGDPPAME